MTVQIVFLKVEGLYIKFFFFRELRWIQFDDQSIFVKHFALFCLKSSFEEVLLEISTKLIYQYTLTGAFS